MTEIREALNSVEKGFHKENPTFVEVNNYSSRRILNLTIEGETSQWHSVKGGISPEIQDPKSYESIRYELLFNPDSNTWLKIVSPKTYGTPSEEPMIERLKKSRQQQQIALELAGLSHLKDQVRDVEVEIEGRKVYGFISPHIGPSLESKIASEVGKKRTINMTPELSDYVTYVYSLAADQAEKLYLDFGIWFPDPNPGNILIREEDDGIHVVLLDFSSRVQERSNIFTGITPGRYPGNKYVEVTKRLLTSVAKDLHKRFAFYCGSIGIPFIRDPEETKRNVESCPTFISAVRKTEKGETP